MEYSHAFSQLCADSQLLFPGKCVFSRNFRNDLQSGDDNHDRIVAVILHSADSGQVERQDLLQYTLPGRYGAGNIFPFRSLQSENRSGKVRFLRGV